MANPAMGILEKIYTKFAHNPDKMLIQTSVVGWAMSSLAQMAAIVINDKIPKEQKMFMIPQEFADGIVNILSFFFVTKSLTNIANKLVNRGKWIEKPVFDFLKKSGAKVGERSFDVLTHGNLPKALEESFLKWRAGVVVGATILGSVLSCNLLTPILRNIYASKRQQGSITRMNDRNNRANETFANTYFKPTMATFRGQASIYPTAGRLKI